MNSPQTSSGSNFRSTIRWSIAVLAVTVGFVTLLGFSQIQAFSICVMLFFVGSIAYRTHASLDGQDRVSLTCWVPVLTAALLFVVSMMRLRPDMQEGYYIGHVFPLYQLYSGGELLETFTVLIKHGVWSGLSVSLLVMWTAMSMGSLLVLLSPLVIIRMQPKLNGMFGVAMSFCAICAWCLPFVRPQNMPDDVRGYWLWSLSQTILAGFFLIWPWLDKPINLKVGGARKSHPHRSSSRFDHDCYRHVLCCSLLTPHHGLFRDDRDNRW